jgi:hypothetical protein
MEKERKRKWIRGAIIACALLAIAVVAAFKWEDCLRALIYHKPVRYDEPFGPAIAGADRIVVRADGFDCCGPVDETNILCVVTEPDQITEVASHIRFESKTTTNSLLETCLCCGGLGIDWYRGKKRIVFTAMQHGDAIRWRGFSTTRILGFRVGYGDGPLTYESQVWMKKWFMSHGIGRKEKEESANKASRLTLTNNKDIMKSIKDIRKWMNDQEKSKFYKVDNYNLTLVEIMGYLLLVCGFLMIGQRVFTNLKWYGWPALILGIIIIYWGLLKKKDKDMNV